MAKYMHYLYTDDFNTIKNLNNMITCKEYNFYNFKAKGD